MDGGGIFLLVIILMVGFGVISANWPKKGKEKK